MSGPGGRTKSLPIKGALRVNNLSILYIRFIICVYIIVNQNINEWVILRLYYRSLYDGSLFGNTKIRCWEA